MADGGRAPHAPLPEPVFACAPGTARRPTSPSARLAAPSSPGSTLAVTLTVASLISCTSPHASVHAPTAPCSPAASCRRPAPALPTRRPLPASAPPHPPSRARLAPQLLLLLHHHARPPAAPPLSSRKLSGTASGASPDCSCSPPRTPPPDRAADALPCLPAHAPACSSTVLLCCAGPPACAPLPPRRYCSSPASPLALAGSVRRWPRCRRALLRCPPRTPPRPATPPIPLPPSAVASIQRPPEINRRPNWPLRP
nr:vegetative cell wall protein gp1-like [Aegilops tauschii subsp. strangulata]